MARLEPYTSKQATGAYDLPSLSDDEDGVSTRSSGSRSTRASDSSATILGYADGPIPSSSPAMDDWKISRVGGLPTFPPLSIPPSPTSAVCGQCGTAMPLLTQIYCPLDDSLFERVVHCFACPRKACRGKEGSVRAWRAGARWVEEAAVVGQVVVEGNGKEKEKARLGDLVFGAGPGPVAATANFNPFAATPASSLPVGNPFAPSPSTAFNPFAPSPVSNPFAAPSPAPLANPFAPPPSAPVSRNLALLTASFASSTISTRPPSPPHLPPQPAVATPSTPSSSWTPPHPSYPPQFLTTAYEPALASSSVPSRLANPVALAPLPEDVDEKHREGKGSGGRVKKGAAAKPGKGAGASGSAGEGWGGEGYEVQKVRGVDDVFLQFQERVAREGLQCVRYEYSGIPLPFSSLSPSYALLFPPTASAPLGAYDPSRIARCRHCGGPTTFEYQLMPHLVALLGRNGPSVIEEGGKAPGAVAATVLDADGVEFATVMVFTCVRECVDDLTEEAWREERVCIELEVD